MISEALSVEREPSSRRAPGKDFLARLKSETAAEHAAIEAAAGVMHPALGLDGYRRYLTLSQAFYQPVEAALTRLGVWHALGLDAEQRAKLPLLARDLEALGVSVAALAPCPAPPTLDGLDEGVGCAYVLEGSTLGGRVISRHVRARLGADVPCAFLDGHGSLTGERWQELRAALGRHAQCRGQEQRIIDGARRTFVAFTRWLTQPAG